MNHGIKLRILFQVTTIIAKGANNTVLSITPYLIKRSQWMSLNQIYVMNAKKMANHAKDRSLYNNLIN
jgi:hypothetical protein